MLGVEARPEVRAVGVEVAEAGVGLRVRGPEPRDDRVVGGHHVEHALVVGRHVGVDERHEPPTDVGVLLVHGGDVGLYGDELVNTRAKTGAAPRIRGDISRNERMTWIVLTLGGTPMLLLLLGFMRGAYRAKLRDEYRLKLEQNEAA